MSYHPKCFTEKQWLEWKAAARGAKPTSYCRDCLPCFKHKMMRDGLCEHPETRFLRAPTRSFDGRLDVEIKGVRVKEMRDDIENSELHFTER